MRESFLTVIIHTRNEEKNISDCIKSAKKLSDDILVVDMESVDETVSQSKRLKSKILSIPHSFYVETARQEAIAAATGPWIFILDADERITDKLAHEIKSKIKNDSFSFYKIPRKNIFGPIARGAWLKHGGWYPDYQIRLINKKNFLSWPKQIHATPKIKGNLGYINEPIIHLFHGDLEGMTKKTILFEDIESDLLFKANKEASTIIFFRKFLGEFFRRMIRQLGFLDGPLGIIESLYQAFSKTITYLFLYEKKIKGRAL